MLLEKLTIGVPAVAPTGLLPVAVFAELSNPGVRLSDQLAIRVMFEELPVGCDRVRSLRRAPILLLPTAGAQQHQETEPKRSFTDCDHHAPQALGYPAIIPTHGPLRESR